jgi:hypothetical protein
MTFMDEYALGQGIRLVRTRSGHTVATSTSNGKLLASGISETAVVGAAAKKLALSQAAKANARRATREKLK